MSWIEPCLQGRVRGSPEWTATAVGYNCAVPGRPTIRLPRRRRGARRVPPGGRQRPGLDGRFLVRLHGACGTAEPFPPPVALPRRLRTRNSRSPSITPGLSNPASTAGRTHAHGTRRARRTRAAAFGPRPRCPDTAWQPVAKAPLHSTGAAPRLPALLRGQILARILPCRAWSDGRSTRLGATRGFTTGCWPTRYHRYAGPVPPTAGDDGRWGRDGPSADTSRGGGGAANAMTAFEERYA